MSNHDLVLTNSLTTGKESIKIKLQHYTRNLNYTEIEKITCVMLISIELIIKLI